MSSRALLLYVYLIVYSNTFGQNRFYVYASTSANFSSRNLEPIGEITDNWKTYFKIRRKKEQFALRESLNFVAGIHFGDFLWAQIGFDYKRLGDREKVEILTLQPSGIYLHQEYRAAHSFYYIGIPLEMKFCAYSNEKWNLNISLKGNYSFLISEKTRKPNPPNTFGNYAVYSDYFTTVNRRPLELGFGLSTLYNFNALTTFELGLTSGYHPKYSFIREEAVEQHNLYVGLKIGIIRYFK